MDSTSETVSQIVSRLRETTSQAGIALDLSRMTTPEPKYRVGFFGEANRGKSTVINQIVGIPVLPTGSTPTTATITTLRSGPNTILRVVLKGNIIDERNLTADSWQDLIVLSGKQAFPEVEVILADSWLDAFPGILLDTPGMNSGVTSGLLDMIEVAQLCQQMILVISATSPLSMTEQQWLRQPFIKTGSIQVTVIVTHLDMSDDADRLLQYVHTQVEKILPGTSILPFYPNDTPEAFEANKAIRAAIIENDPSQQLRQQQQRFLLQLDDFVTTTLDVLKQEALEHDQGQQQAQEESIKRRQRVRSTLLQLNELQASIDQRRLRTQDLMMKSSQVSRDQIVEHTSNSLPLQGHVSQDWLTQKLLPQVDRELESALTAIREKYQTELMNDEQLLQKSWPQTVNMPSIAGIKTDIQLPQTTRTISTQSGEIPPIGHMITQLTTVASVISAALLFKSRRILALAIGTIGAGGSLATDQWIQSREREQIEEIRQELINMINQVFDQFDDSIRSYVQLAYNEWNNAVRRIVAEEERKLAVQVVESQARSFDTVAKLTSIQSSIRKQLGI